MVWDDLGPQARQNVEQILGYLNFSSGVSDPRFLGDVNRVFGLVQSHLSAGTGDHGGRVQPEPAWRALGRLLGTALDRLRDSSEAFRRVDQAEAVLRLVFEQILPAYRRHHRDLLFHQTEESLFQPFFIGRVCEVALAEGGPWDQAERITAGTLRRLNDFIGHRPVAVLQNEQKLQPYVHEWVRPIPLFIEGAGVAVGRWQAVIETMLEILRATDADLLRQAWFDPELLEELALDPRAFDFDHPVNRRPNHHFGGWDPHTIDNRGHYRRFVLQHVTLDALWARVDGRGKLPYEELLFEAAAVLAGTMLMGSGITGSGPDSHDSGTTLATLLPHIAGYRDAFYERLMGRLPRAHARRLAAEASALRQPFGGARQDLNQKLARCRAEQLQHVHLARLFARMGYPEAATRQARVVPVASARLRCEIDCRLSAAHLELDRGGLDAAAGLVGEIEDLLHRGIECGALVDPWNILGFGGQFSLFPAVENSIHDHRIDELIELMNEIFGLYARLEKEAVAAGQAALQRRLSDDLRALARWWDRFASTEVGDVEGISGHHAWESAAQVATALAAWQEAGTAAGDVAFWQSHVEQFHSPEAFALLAEALIEQGDLVASMALLMYWVGQAEPIPLAEGNSSFHELAVRWMEALWQVGEPAGRGAGKSPIAPRQRWPLTRKFFDYLEANAEEYWPVPRLELLGESAPTGADDEAEEEDDSHGLYGAAYEGVVYRDTTDDGFEGEIFDGGTPATEFELAVEAERISHHLLFLTTVARLWKLSAGVSASPDHEAEDRNEALSGWLARAVDNRQQLLDLLAVVHRYRIPAPRGTHESLVEYDRRRGIKEVLLERIIAACVETADAGLFIRAMLPCRQAAGAEDWQAPAEEVLRAVARGDAAAARAACPQLLEALARQPLLYVPTSRGGNPRRLVDSRSVQRLLRRLLAQLPRLGLLTETYRLIETIQRMERDHPAGPGAITEFDRLFEIGCKGIVRCLVVSSESWPVRPPKGQSRRRRSDLDLIDHLEEAIQRLLERWLAHSRNIRLSVLEAVRDKNRWQALRRFIQRYGRDLFTQKFMNFGNLRAILHQGADAYLRSLEEEPDAEEGALLLADLDGRLRREEAVRWLELTLEAVVENYPEYIDYNSTTTQSDHGEMLYTLLDFLRLGASYERVTWNLKPVAIVHQVMVGLGRNRAAELWRREVARRTAGVADDHLKRFRQMSGEYGMRLPSIADRLNQRLVRPLAIDRLRALVRPAIEELRGKRPGRSFQRLEQETARFTEEPGGVGFDLPSWLEALENEVQQVRARPAETEDEESQDPSPDLPQVRLSMEEVEQQVQSWQDEGDV